MSSEHPENNCNNGQYNSNGWIKELFKPLSIFTGMLVVVAALQTCILSKTDDTLSDTLKTNKLSQRAFVFPTLAQTYLSPDLVNPEGINFFFSLSNNGNTATKNFKFFMKCAPSAEDLDEPWILTVQGRGKFEEGTAVIGPKSANPAGCSFPISQLKEIVAKKLFGFILIDISYEDGMNPGIIRKTQMALRISQVLYAPAHTEGANTIGAVASVLMQNRGAHNCADEECPK